MDLASNLEHAGAVLIAAIGVVILLMPLGFLMAFFMSPEYQARRRRHVRATTSNNRWLAAKTRYNRG